MHDKDQGVYGEVNRARYRGRHLGHYESFFQRPTHHRGARSTFWIRYTLFSPALRPEDAYHEELLGRISSRRYTSGTQRFKKSCI